MLKEEKQSKKLRLKEKLVKSQETNGVNYPYKKLSISKT